MSSGEKSDHDSEHEFLDRVLRYQEKSLSPEELLQLNDDLRNHPERLAEFTRVCETSRLIQEVSEVPAREKPKAKSVIRPPFSRWAWIEHAGIAALLMLCLGLGVLFWQRDRGERNWGDSVALLEFCSEDAAFSDRHQMPSEEGDLLGKGWVHLERGTVRIAFRSGAIVELEGETTFGIDSPMRSYLEYGNASVYAPESARDFVVGTTSMEVVDLGTRFNLSVDQDSGAAEVNVTEGLVDLHLGGEGTPRRIQPLPAGLLARVDGSGEVNSIDGEPLDSDMALGNSLLAHWTMDEIGADSTMLDASGNERHAFFRGDFEGGKVDGRNGGAVDLKGGGYIDISDHIEALTNVSAFTFSAWVRDARNIVFSFSDGSPRNRIQFELYGRRLLYGWQKGARFDAIHGRVSGWNKGRWYHVVVAVSGGQVTIYRDGRLLNSQSSGQKISAKTLALIDIDDPTQAFIGYLPSNHSHQPQALGGQIDDVQFYRQALDARGVEFLFENPGATWKGGENP